MTSVITEEEIQCVVRPKADEAKEVPTANIISIIPRRHTIKMERDSQKDHFYTWNERIYFSLSTNYDCTISLSSLIFHPCILFFVSELVLFIYISFHYFRMPPACVSCKQNIFMDSSYVSSSEKYSRDGYRRIPQRRKSRGV